VNCLRDIPMTQFSIPWILSLNHLSHFWGQVQEGVKLLAHKRLLRDWELLLKDHKKRVKGGKNRWTKSGKKNSDHSGEDAPEDAETGTDIDESAV